MDEIRRPRPEPAHPQGRFSAPARRSEKPALVWNPVIRQWWTPPEKSREQATTVEQPQKQAIKTLVVRPQKPQKTTVTINFHLPRSISKRDIIRVLIHGPNQPKSRWGSRLYQALKINRWPRYSFSASVLAIIFVLLLEVVAPAFNQNWQSHAYALSEADKLVLAKPTDDMGKDLKHDIKNQVYNFNADFAPENAAANVVSFGGAKIKAELHDDSSKGMTVTDPYNNVDFTLTPSFSALAARQSKNQVQYPILSGAGSLVYTAEASGVKEDILVKQQIGDKLKFSYKLGLGDQYAARLMSDGSLGIYGSNLPINGNISTGSDKDATLLQKARKKAVKDKLLFSMPAPIIHESGGHSSKAQASFSLKGDKLTVSATNLKQAAYPLSIDPSISVVTISDFYRNMSIESNADFDATNNRINRGALTGGTTGTWTATTTMNQARFLNGAAVYNGYVYVVGGSNAASTTNLAGTNANMVEYASIDTANPSVFGSWVAGNNSGLPAGGLSRFQLIAYHGFLYAIGGSGTDTTCAAANISTVVYHTPIQVNGVLGAWTTTNAPATKRCSFGATTYDGKIYIAGGKTDNTAAAGSTDVSYAVVDPSGTLTWTSGVSVALPLARYGNDIQAYNGYLYVVGGETVSAGVATVTNTVFYAALTSTGAIYGSSSANWLATNNFTTARENFGTVFTTIKAGYIYLTGGCKAVNASQTCNTAGDVMIDTQLAQINADGSLGQWFATTSLTGVRVGAAMTVWRGTVYNIGGCAAMNAASIFCTTALGTTQYATITTPGQASVLKTGANTLPTALFGAASVVNNGYLYVVGGCKTNSCQTGTADTTNLTSIAQINADGTLGAWSTGAQTINGATGLAETSLFAANGILYAFGGYRYDGSFGASAGLNNIFTVTPSTTTGLLGANWASNATTMTSREYGMSILYYNGNAYTLGGCVASATTFGCSTYSQEFTKYSINGTTIGAGSTTNLTQLTATTVDFPNAVMALAFYDGYVYLCGGATASTGTGQTQYCTFIQLLSNGTTTGKSWAKTTAKLNDTTSPVHPIRRAAAYASNGYLYVYSGHDGVNSAAVGTINIGKIDPSTGDIATFSVSTTAFTPKWDTTSAFTNGNIYTIGGCTAGDPPISCSARSNATEYFAIYNATNNGTRAIQSGTALSNSYTGSSGAAYNGYIYIAAGCGTYALGTGNCSATTNNVSYAVLNPDGAIGTWTNITSGAGSLPANSGFGGLVALNGYLYYMGGENNSGTAQTAVYYSLIGAAGVPGTFNTASNVLPVAKTRLATAVFNNHIYVTGGSTSTTVYYSPALPSGGDITSAWTSTTAFSTGRSNHAAVAVGGYLYIMGGYDGTNFLSDVQYAPITISTGAVGSWSASLDLPFKMRQMTAFAAYGYIYLLGGATGTASTSCLNTTFVATVNANGTTSSWSQGVATSYTAIEGNAVAYYNGYYYILGGNSCAGNANVTTVSYAGVQSQAIRAIFSRYIDLVGDATPEKFLANGTNAQLSSTDIETWRLTYNSSRIATNAFGADSVIKPIVFGANPVAISAIDASSVSQGVSRYWVMTFDIDQTASFAFTDDTQPTISAFSFYYAPAGNTRLRNGRIFQDQTKQSLDAHP
jgi:hypothetical protein